jgi:uncharacterized protein (DUF488 family)
VDESAQPIPAVVPLVYTIGHSNLTLEAFVAALREVGVRTVVDVRSAPYSKFAPHFNRKALERHLPAHGIAYRFAGEYLGGRPTDPTCYFNGVVPDGSADYLSLVNYDEVGRRAWFQAGARRLLELAAEGPVAIMCSEEDPDRCHRRHLIARTLSGQAQFVDIRTRGGETRTEPWTPPPKQAALL